MDETESDVVASPAHRITTADLARTSDSQSTDENRIRDHQTTAAPLLQEREAADFRAQWDQIQTGFVDEPRKAVEDADALVAAAMKRLAEVFASERSQLEGQWDRGDNVSTEDLRLALQRYRSFFGRLLSI